MASLHSMFILKYINNSFLIRLREALFLLSRQYESIGTPPDPARNFPTRSEGRESEPRDDPHTPSGSTAGSNFSNIEGSSGN